MKLLFILFSVGLIAWTSANAQSTVSDANPVFKISPGAKTDTLISIVISIHDDHRDLTSLHFVYASATDKAKAQTMLKPSSSTVSADTHTITYTLAPAPILPTTVNFEAGLGNLDLSIETPYSGGELSKTGKWIPLD